MPNTEAISPEVLKDLLEDLGDVQKLESIAIDAAARFRGAEQARQLRMVRKLGLKQGDTCDLDKGVVVRAALAQSSSKE